MILAEATAKRKKLTKRKDLYLKEIYTVKLLYKF